MNTNGKHTFQQNVLTYINQYFEKDINSGIKRIRKSSSDNMNEGSVSLQLKALSSYKLKDLQDLAANNSINIMKEDNKGKEKNKTKTELYNELKVL